MEKPPENRPDIVLVLGMHRSGTSLLAEALHRAGLAVGREMIADEPGVNARGFWEDRRVVEINEAILKRLNSSWFDLRPLPPGWPDGESLAPLLTEAAELLNRDYRSRRPALIKDPRLCLLLPFWQRAIQQCGLTAASILLLRSPLAVARSLQRRDRLPLDYGLLLWLRYNLAAQKACDANATLSYDALLDGGAGALEAVMDELKLPARPGSSELEAVFDPSLRHHPPEEPESGEHPLLSLASGEYRRLLAGAPAAPELPLPSPDDLVALCSELATAQLSAQSELTRIGGLHSEALEVIRQRDSQLKQRDRDCAYAESLVRQRDSQLEAQNSELARAEALIRQRDEELARRNEDCAYAESLVRQRDAELAQRNRDCAYAEALVRERDDALRQLNERVSGLRKLPGARLAERYLNWLDRRR